MVEKNTGNRFAIFVTYSQLAVFLDGLNNPFNDWTPRHTNQGFSWRPGSVSFRTLDESGSVLIKVGVKRALLLRDNALRVIRVPFRVSERGVVEVASITDGRKIKVPQGKYNLVCEMGRDADGTTWCNLWFVTTPEAPAAVLVADEELVPEEPLLMKADAATA